MKNALKILTLIMVVSMFASCSNYGKKVTFEGTKGEVYYKGDGVTEADAKKLGDYLKTIDYINNSKESSFQLTKKDGDYLLKLVINKAVYDSIKGLDQSYKALGVLVSQKVFDGKKVDIGLTNDVFEDFKTIPYDEAYAKSLNNDGGDDFGKDVLIDGTKGEVFIKGDGVTEADAQRLGQQLRKITFLNDTTHASVQLLKNGNGYIVRFVYDKHFYETTPDVVKNFNIIRSSISNDVFGGQNVDIRLADEKMQDFVTIPTN
jgi:hypothetical protein